MDLQKLMTRQLKRLMLLQWPIILKQYLYHSHLFIGNKSNQLKFINPLYQLSTNPQHQSLHHLLTNIY